MEMKAIAPNPEPFLARRFAIGETVFGIRDVELSNPAAVVGYERGLVLVKFDDGVPRAVPVQSLQRPADQPDRPRMRPDTAERTLYSEAANFGDYLRLMGEAESELLPKEKENEKNTR